MIKKAIALLIVLGLIISSFHALLPGKISDSDTDTKAFSSARALVHLKEISQAPHYVGSAAHNDVQEYIVDALKELGLTPQLQTGFSISKWGNMAKPTNILARIKGSESGKALLLLSHYDSAAHASFGASDAGSGVVTILEAIRAFLASERIPKNDIIILISDAEELGLNGADIFVNEHEWAQDVGLVLNFEARGSGGASWMLLETNQGNAKLIDAYKKANPSHPVGNSLAYSIYKMLPNDTDLTRFRVDGDIDGFNFAFIDDHFDYHTANDTYERLDRKTLEHQGSYAMALLNYFADADLTNLKSEHDDVYFNIPLLKQITFSYDLIFPMLFLALLVLIVLVTLGIKRGRLQKSDIAKGFTPFFVALLLNIIVGILLWEVIKLINPQYEEILHGFTYNGHSYILAFVFLSIGICALVYSKYFKPGTTASTLIAPLVFWWLICLLFAMYLKGGSFFMIPLYFSLLILFILIQQRKPGLWVLALLHAPLLWIISPLVQMFPVGLGFYLDIGMLEISVKVVSMILVVMSFGLLLSVFGFFKHKRRWSFIMFVLAGILLIYAQLNANFNEERPRPNSLVYMLDIDSNKASWATYDNRLDDWTKTVLGDDPSSASDLNKNTIASKYRSGFTFTREAPVKAFVYPEVEIFKDTLIGDYREVSIYIASKRNAQRFEMYSDSQYRYKDFEINGIKVKKRDENAFAFENRWNSRLFSYFVTGNEPLEIHLKVPRDQQTTKLVLYESTHDLIENRNLGIQPRPATMLPKPFVLNDAVILKKTIVIN